MDFSRQWEQILQADENHNVDILATIHEDGFNNFLRKHFEIDSQLPAAERKYHQVFERTFQTFGDPRKFKVTLSLTQPLKIKLPPFTEAGFLKDRSKKGTWQALDYPIDGPDLNTFNVPGENLVEVVAPGVTVTLEWPRLNGAGSPWTFTIPPFEVLGQAALELFQEEQDFFVRIIPKFIKIDIPRNTLQSLVEGKLPELLQEESECDEKFTDLFIIAANIAAYEQTPKMVTNIKLPVPVIQERPIQPALLDISNDMLTVGFGIDKINLDRFNNNVLDARTAEMSTLLKMDIEAAGGLMNMAFKNTEGKTIKSANQLLPRDAEEQDLLFANINSFIAREEEYVRRFNEDGQSALSQAAVEKAAAEQAATFAIGINEYFFDTVVGSVLPQPKHRCENDVSLGLVKGYICHWTSFTNPDVTISNNATFSGAVDVNVGGSIHACVKKFWDCSWRWACAKLALAIAGRPMVSLNVLPANGIRLSARLNGNLALKTNLPYPFNKVVEALSGVVFKFMMAFINVLLSLLSFYVIRPEIAVEELNLKISLQNFSSFYFERAQGAGRMPSKNKFLCFSTNLKIEKL